MGQRAPWEGTQAKDLLFVLITGGNSGTGLGFCRRIIDEFLATRSTTANLILIPTTRSVAKSREIILAVRKHLSWTAAARRRRGVESEAAVLARIHFASLQLDLVNLPAVYAAANNLLSGSIDLYPHANDVVQTVPVRIPRLDALVFNAANGGWIGLDWWRFLHAVPKIGIRQSLTWPVGIQTGELTVIDKRSKSMLARDAPTDTPLLGEIFCSNIFGHYVFAHELMPLLSRSTRPDDYHNDNDDDDDDDDFRGNGAPEGRIVWVSSLDAVAECFSVDDMQGLRSYDAYSSSKRLVDILTLTAELPAVRPHAASFFAIEDAAVAKELPVRPRVYVTHPGLVATSFFPLAWVLFPAYQLGLFIARWLGSPWHTIMPYRSACALVWAVLECQDALDKAEAQRVKWGSSCSRLYQVAPKMTEVDGWGWEGKYEPLESLGNDPVQGVLRKAVGRRDSKLVMTPESPSQFEETGAVCWQEMENLRRKWEGVLGLEKGGA